MARAKKTPTKAREPDNRTPSIMVRIPLDLVERIDAERGMIPREPYIRSLIEQSLPRRRAKRAR